MEDIRSHLANRAQLTTDSHKAYLMAVEETFGGDMDYAQLKCMALPKAAFSKKLANHIHMLSL